MLEILIVLLALALIVGIGVSAHWDVRRQMRVAAAEMAFTRTLLGKLAEPLGLTITDLPPESGIPSTPMLIGTYLGHEVRIKPTFTQYSGDGFSVTYRDPSVTVVVTPLCDRYWRFPVLAQHPWHTKIFSYWKSRYLREEKERLAALLPGAASTLRRLFDPERRPLRVTEASLAARSLSIVAEYVAPPKVRFEGRSFRIRTDPVDLRHILDDILVIADALPSEPD
jgi:hypothetical protein